MTCTISIFLLICTLASSVYGSNLKHYIVYMGEHSLPSTDAVINSNHEMLSSYVGSLEEAENAVVHHFTKSFRGFSAMLTPEQADVISKNSSVVSVFESTAHHLQTTRSWDFMEDTTTDSVAKGVFYQLRKHTSNDVIVGHFDSGVWPEARTFQANGLGPVPNRFRGECVTGQDFGISDCNGKIIGARYYYQGYAQDNGPPDATGAVYYSPRDDFGHGSHTASTAVGEEVNNVILPGVSNLTAKGGAPRARLAVYKVCWHNSCSCADILKAYDDAISDGVDIITISITGNSKSNYFEDCFAIGAFHAYKNGILVSASAGNDGGYRTVANAAPWFLTVAASTIDREAYTFLRLGNGEVVRGYGLNLYQLEGYYPLVEASYCQRNMLQYSVIRDTIVLCLVNGVDDSIDEKAEVLKEGGAVGMIVISNSNIIYNYAVPTAIVGGDEANKLAAYLQTTNQPSGGFLQNSMEINTKPAPKMAAFSSKGPSAISPDIIKPDITAPGVNILAAWLPNLETQAVDAVAYRFESGTSMACPHATGVAAVVKAVRRTWTPTAIKSALMTTATLQDNTGGLIKSGQYQATPFDLGSGHLNPDLAVDPGLVYDFDIDDIIDFLCVQSANEWQLQNIVGRPVFCKTPPVAAYNLNYPSIGINYLDRPTSVYRTVTFKGKRNDPKTYKVSIEYPPGIKMRVVPDVLDFSDGSTKATYRVDFVPNGANGYVFGSITWSDGQEHNVRSPIAVNVV